MMRSLRDLAFVLAFSMPLLAAAPSFANGNVVTDETIREMFGQTEGFGTAHGLMLKLREKLGAILDSFLIGDSESVAELSADISKSMSQVMAQVPLDEDKEAAGWQLMTEIVMNSKAMQKAVQASNYPKAYDHYAQIGARCIQCHQMARNWGRLPDKPQQPVDLSPASVPSPPPSEPSPKPEKAHLDSDKPAGAKANQKRLTS